MALVTNREIEDTYTSSDGSIFIDFDAIDEEVENDEEKEK